jgi:DnaJ-class molecular chaperone
MGIENIDILKPEGHTARCPGCRGTGVILVNPTGGFGLNPGNRMDEKACPKCGGTGEIEEK